MSTDSPTALGRQLALHVMRGLVRDRRDTEASSWSREARRVWPSPISPAPLAHEFSLESFPDLPPPSPLDVDHCEPFAMLPLALDPSADVTGWKDGMLGLLLDAHAAGPFTLELLGSRSGIWLSLHAPPSMLATLAASVRARTPLRPVMSSVDPLASLLRSDGHVGLVETAAALEVGYHERLAPGPSLARLIAATFHALADDELGIAQVMMAGCSPAWTPNVRALYEATEKLAVLERSALAVVGGGEQALRAAMEKTSSPLFGVVLRLAVVTPRPQRIRPVTRELRNVVHSVRQGPASWEFVSLRAFHNALGSSGVRDMLATRRSHRIGVLLSASEAARLLPDSGVVSNHLVLTLPGRLQEEGVVLGLSRDGQVVRWPTGLLSRSARVYGKTGSGKSWMLVNACLQLAEKGIGWTILDPHGDAAMDVLSRLPETMRERVVVLDPSLPGVTARYNPLRIAGREEVVRKAESVALACEHATASFGQVMRLVLTHGLYLVLHGDEPCFADVPTILAPSPGGIAARARLLPRVRGTECERFFLQDFPSFSAASLRPLLGQVGRVLLHPVARRMLARRGPSLDVRGLMDESKCVVVRLPSGVIGQETTSLLGGFILGDIYAAAMRRADTSHRPLHVVLVDEVPRFLRTGGEIAGFLAETRKYGVGMVLCAQQPEQVSSIGAVENTAVTVAFAQGVSGARELSGELRVPAGMLQELRVGEAVARIDAASVLLRTLPLPAPCTNPRVFIEASIARYYEPQTADGPPDVGVDDGEF